MGEANFYPASMPGGQRWSSAGLAAVWAQENTRGSLYDAMLRKETYATSGPRIVVRFFGGWNYPKDLFKQQNWVAQAEQHGVTMGQTLPAGDAAAPAFAVWAMRDPLSGNLDRIQIIKGWVDDAGKSHEKLFNVAWSGAAESRHCRQLIPSRQHGRCNNGHCIPIVLAAANYLQSGQILSLIHSKRCSTMPES